MHVWGCSDPHRAANFGHDGNSPERFWQARTYTHCAIALRRIEIDGDHHVMICIGNRVNVAFIPNNFDNHFLSPPFLPPHSLPSQPSVPSLCWVASQSQTHFLPPAHLPSPHSPQCPACSGLTARARHISCLLHTCPPPLAALRTQSMSATYLVEVLHLQGDTGGVCLTGAPLTRRATRRHSLQTHRTTQL